ncbi:hypothetical protein [Clostridium argentinense]|nr:hypothetical protein [Clostridium argentinense]
MTRLLINIELSKHSENIAKIHKNKIKTLLYKCEEELVDKK